MESTYRVTVFGKKGCSKCERLKDRLQKLLKGEEWREFGMHYHDITTEDGLVAFARKECLNPQRIPSLLVEKRDTETGEYRPLPNPKHTHSLTGLRPLRYLGLQTDYSEEGKGIIPPEALNEVLQQARGS